MNRMKADLAREGDGLRTRRCRIFLGLEGAMGDLLTGRGVATQRRRSLKGWWIFSLPSFRLLMFGMLGLHASLRTRLVKFVHKLKLRRMGMKPFQQTSWMPWWPCLEAATMLIPCLMSGLRILCFLGSARIWVSTRWRPRMSGPSRIFCGRKQLPLRSVGLVTTCSWRRKWMRITKQEPATALPTSST